MAMTIKRTRLLLSLYVQLCPDEVSVEQLMTDPRAEGIAWEMDRVVAAQTDKEAAAVIIWWNAQGQGDWREGGALKWVKRYRKLFAKGSSQGHKKPSASERKPRK